MGIPTHSDICKNIPISVPNSDNLTRFLSFWFCRKLTNFACVTSRFYDTNMHNRWNLRNKKINNLFKNCENIGVQIPILGGKMYFRPFSKINKLIAIFNNKRVGIPESPILLLTVLFAVNTPPLLRAKIAISEIFGRWRSKYPSPPLLVDQNV